MPATGAYFPAKHDTHEDPPAPNFPAAYRLQRVKVESEVEPGLQDEKAEAPAAEYCPGVVIAVQSVSNALPVNAL